MQRDRCLIVDRPFLALASKRVVLIKGRSEYGRVLEEIVYTTDTVRTLQRWPQ